MKITSVKAIQIFDSRGKPTVRTFLFLDDGSYHFATVPSGASTGSHEAVELRDHDEKKYLGQGVEKAVGLVNNEIKKALAGLEISDTTAIDDRLLELDGSENKSRFGANSLLAVSLAAQRAAAHSQNLMLWQFSNQKYFTGIAPAFPKLMLNVVNGGRHANWDFDIQEFIIIPNKYLPSASLEIGTEIYQTIGNLLKIKKLSPLVGDEGGYSPLLKSNEEVFGLIVEAAQRVGYTNGQDFFLGIDAAASEFFTAGKYVLKKDSKIVSAADLTNYYLKLINDYRVFSFEDPFAEDDWENFSALVKTLDDRWRGRLIVGDDLFCTNTKRMTIGKEKNAANAVIIKPNQIGTIKETVAAINLAKQYNWKVIISHRSGETEDSFIADLGFGCAADYLKAGAPARSDRLAKYNRLLEIENNL